MPVFEPVDDYFERIRARERAKEEETKNEILRRLQQCGVLPDEEVKSFKLDVILDQGDRLGRTGPMRRTRQSEQDYEDKFRNISLHYFKPSVVRRIESHTPKGRCVQIYEEVMAAIPSRIYSWETGRTAEPVCGANEDPATPFSVCRAAPEAVKSNAELIDTLALVTDMSPGSAVAIRGSIVFHDSRDPKSGVSGGLCMDTMFVGVGRLGRNHMLADVPNHHVRDRLMDYIDTKLQEDKREIARRAVFADLDDSEIAQYSEHVARLQREAAERSRGSPRTQRYFNDMAARNASMDTIDTDIDLTPRPGRGGCRRDYAGLKRLDHSVLRPGLKGLPIREAAADVLPGDDMDWDCDQIRAMIVLFTRSPGGIGGIVWYFDEFRLALGVSASPQRLSVFLAQRGPAAGAGSQVHQLAWEFFKKRELLGEPRPSATDADTDADTDSVLGESIGGGNRGAKKKKTKKRSSAGGESGQKPRKRRAGAEAASSS
ncbi:hypothetical protein GGR56DRAFT_234555 [Xylariaceae sp. FL0804]|nr:hypothetical protein GGR56DRAFT_234555 [Xylariaceae sp. FL0804]